MKWSGFSDEEIERFRHFQTLSFEIQQSIASTLRTGVTERDIAKAMMKAYRAEGVGSYFHLPVVLFGERTTLPDPWSTGHFWPKDRPLEPGDSVILDASPIFDGLLVDTSTTVCHLPSGSSFQQAAKDDLGYRTSIIEAVRASATFQEIAIEVDQQFAASGYRNCHRLHPGEVLGHRVGDVSGSESADDMGFATEVVDWFFTQLASPATDSDSVQTPAPTWSANPGSDHPPADGLWAVEPHLGKGSVGVKWEEVLVIQGSDVFWLQDNPPHVVAAA